MGAPDPRTDGHGAVQALTPEEAKTFWSFQPVRKQPTRRRSKDAAWARTDIDRFVLARLEAKGLHAGRPTPTGRR